MQRFGPSNEGPQKRPMSNRRTPTAVSNADGAPGDDGASPLYEWRVDPSGSWEQRYFSHGQATNLVMHDGVMTFDDLAWADSTAIPRFTGTIPVPPTAAE